jgi:hypothetical protein
VTNEDGSVNIGTIASDISSIANDVLAIKAQTDTLPPGIKKGKALPGFQVLMVQSNDHITGATGKMVLCERSIDGGGFAPCTNAMATEISAGMYYVNLSDDDLDGDIITFKFTADDCDTRFVTIKTEA